MGTAQLALLVQLIEAFAALRRPFSFLMDRLSAAAYAAARACHDLNEVIVSLSALNLLDNLLRILQAADNAGLQHLAGNLKLGSAYAPQIDSIVTPLSTGVPYRLEGILVSFLPGYHLVGSAEGSLHHAAGNAKNSTCTGAITDRRIKRLFLQAPRVNMLRPKQAHHLTGSQHIIHILIAAGIHGFQSSLTLLGNARHDGNGADIFRGNSCLFRKISLDQGTENLLRALGSGQLPQKLRVIHGKVRNPARAAGGEHRHLLLGTKPLQKLIALLHDGHISGEHGVQHIVKANALQGCHQPALGVNPRLHVIALQPGSAHCRSNLHHGHLIRVCQDIIDSRQIIALLQGTCRAMGDALAAQGALGLRNRHVVHGADIGIRTCILHIPNIAALYLAANLQAANALDALLGIPDQRKIIVPDLLRYLSLKRQVINAQMTGQCLQRTVAGAHAGSTEAVVLGQDKLHIGLSHASCLGGVGEHHHALADRGGTSRNQLVLALNLHHADLAGRNLIYPLQEAEMRNVNPQLLGCFHYGSAFLHGKLNIINLQVYHLSLRPPFRAENPYLSQRRHLPASWHASCSLMHSSIGSKLCLRIPASSSASCTLPQGTLSARSGSGICTSQEIICL